MQNWKNLTDTLQKEKNLDDAGFRSLLTQTGEADAELFARADQVRRAVYGDAVYIRGLIEFTNICKNDCYYCGIRRSNRLAVRYRLTKEQVLACCRQGYDLGFRTFVLQGGEDPYFTDAVLCDWVESIKNQHPDCAVTLSVGERSRESYRALYLAGADRYLLRHETATAAHYGQLHPPEMQCENRRRCLYDLKEIGFQVGAGMMVGSPYQTTEHLLADLRFLQQLQPDMIGIGPFIHHKDTPFAHCPDGSVTLTLRLLAILRLLFPYVLLPATTALGTLAENGRERGLQAGANVVMPNLSPPDAREKYMLYQNKLHTGAESAEQLDRLKQAVQTAGYRVVTDVGHVKR